MILRFNFFHYQPSGVDRGEQWRTSVHECNIQESSIYVLIFFPLPYFFLVNSSGHKIFSCSHAFKTLAMPLYQPVSFQFITIYIHDWHKWWMVHSMKGIYAITTENTISTFIIPLNRSKYLQKYHNFSCKNLYICTIKSLDTAWQQSH